MAGKAGRHEERGNLLGSEYQLSTDATDVHFSLGDEPERPWKKVALAGGLMLLGLVMFCTGIGLKFGSSDDSPALPLIILGSICLVPGSYYSGLAFRAWRGDRGYSLNSIPDF